MKQLYLLAFLLLIPAASAQLNIDGISTDPAVLAAGDSVDVIVHYSTQTANDRLGDEDWAFRLRLVAGDEQTQEFVRITDPQGRDRFATLPAGATRTKVYRVHVSEQAPSGRYAFKLEGEWALRGVPQPGLLTERFDLDVKREAIVLSVADIQSEPQRLLPGSREAALHVNVANSGVKDSVDTTIRFQLPEGIKPSYASGSQVYLGSVPAGERAQATLFVDVDKSLASGEYVVPVQMRYKDDSQNAYSSSTSSILYVSEKPRLEVNSSLVRASTASDVVIELMVTNTGVVAAEAIDVRLLKESNQPFSLETRSGYIGKLAPGESGLVRVVASVDRHAVASEYNIPVLVRAKGDSDENDQTIYTYRSSTSVEVTQRSTNSWVVAGIVLVLVLAGLFAWRKLR